MTISRSVLTATVIAATFALSGCFDPALPPVPPPGQTRLDVPFHTQIDTNLNNYCVPATVLMWMDYVNPAPFPDTYEDIIFSYAYNNGWAGPDGVDNNRIPLVLTNFIGYSTSRYQYNGAAGIKQGVADQQKGITFGNPTLVEANYGIHAVLVVGSSWQQLSTAQPSIDYMVVHDPAKYHPAFMTYTLHDWMQFKGLSCYGACVGQTMRQGQYFAAAELAEFESEGGTYYGDPAPPVSGRWKGDGNGGCYWDPNDFGPDQCSQATGRWKSDGNGGCYWDPNDSGPDQCSPSGMARLRRLEGLGVQLAGLRTAATRSLRRSALGMFAGGPFRRSSSTPLPVASPVVHQTALTGQKREAPADVTRRPPYPKAVSEDQILANILFAVRQMRLPSQIGSELFEQDGALVVGRVLDVVSEVTADYYVVELNDKAGNAYADVLIAKDGWLKSVADMRAGRAFPVPRLDEVTKKLQARFKGSLSAHYYFAGGTLQGGAGDQYVPLIKADTESGPVLIDINLQMYQELPVEQFGESREAATSDLGRKRAGQQFLVKKNGIARVVKIGQL